MNIKLTWESILPKYRVNETLPNVARHDDIVYDNAILDCIYALKKAEKEGRVCLNPPSEEKIEELIKDEWCHYRVSTEVKHYIAKAISKRLRVGL